MFSVVKSPYSGRGLEIYRDINNERDYLGVEVSLEFVRDSGGKTPYLAEIDGFSKEYRYERRFLGSPSADIMRCMWQVFYPLEGLLWRDRPILIEARAYGRSYAALYRDLAERPIVYQLTEAAMRELLAAKLGGALPIEPPRRQRTRRRGVPLPPPVAPPQPLKRSVPAPVLTIAGGRVISFEDE